MIANNHDRETKALHAFLALQPETGRGVHEGAPDLPKISVIMPSFNQVEYIERSILSVLNQGYPNLEFIIIDGGSKDGTLDIIRKYESKLAYWHSAPDKGQSDALNQGFSKATGDIFGWLNSDDLYLPGAFDEVIREFEHHPMSSVIFGDYWSIDRKDNFVCLNYAFDFSINHFVYEGFHLNSQAMFWRREAHRRFGQFDIDLQRTMDYDLILRLGMREGERAFVRISRSFACFRRHGEQKTRVHEENVTLGYDPVVRQEHQLIARKNGFVDKYSLLAKLYRMAYRVRRAYWYARRGGIGYIFLRLAGKCFPFFELS